MPRILICMKRSVYESALALNEVSEQFDNLNARVERVVLD